MDKRQTNTKKRPSPILERPIHGIIYMGWQDFFSQQADELEMSTQTNIAKGTTDPRVEFYNTKVTSLGHITSSNTNLDQISSESRPCINFNCLFAS